MRPAFGKGTVSLLSDETKSRLNIDCSTLAPGSHTMVLVRCNRCGERFLREFRHLDHLHHCPAIINGQKWCGHCERYLPVSAFNLNPSRAGGFDLFCRDCKEQLRLKHRFLGGAREWLSFRINQLKSHYEGECDIDVDYMLGVLEQQHGKCFISKVKLEFGSNSLRAASLERLDQDKGFIRGNVVFVADVSKVARTGNSDLSNILLELIDGLSSRVRLETRITSPDGQLPSRKRTYDAGYDIASISEVLVQPHTTENIDTGLIISPPDGFYYSIEGRSSLWKKGIVPCRGIIDSSYTGDLMVAIQNHSDVPYTIRKGDRIAQLILHKMYHADFALVDSFSEVEFGRSAAGFGSSGR